MHAIETLFMQGVVSSKPVGEFDADAAFRRYGHLFDHRRKLFDASMDAYRKSYNRYDFSQENTTRQLKVLNHFIQHGYFLHDEPPPLTKSTLQELQRRTPDRKIWDGEDVSSCNYVEALHSLLTPTKQNISFFYDMTHRGPGNELLAKGEWKYDEFGALQLHTALSDYFKQGLPWLASLGHDSEDESIRNLSTKNLKRIVETIAALESYGQVYTLAVVPTMETHRSSVIPEQNINSYMSKNLMRLDPTSIGMQVVQGNRVIMWPSLATCLHELTHGVQGKNYRIEEDIKGDTLSVRHTNKNEQSLIDGPDADVLTLLGFPKRVSHSSTFVFSSLGPTSMECRLLRSNANEDTLHIAEPHEVVGTIEAIGKDGPRNIDIITEQGVRYRYHLWEIADLHRLEVMLASSQSMTPDAAIKRLFDAHQQGEKITISVPSGERQHPRMSLISRGEEWKSKLTKGEVTQQEWIDDFLRRFSTFYSQNDPHSSIDGLTHEMTVLADSVTLDAGKSMLGTLIENLQRQTLPAISQTQIERMHNHWVGRVLHLELKLLTERIDELEKLSNEVYKKISNAVQSGYQPNSAAALTQAWRRDLQYLKQDRADLAQHIQWGRGADGYWDRTFQGAHQLASNLERAAADDMKTLEALERRHKHPNAMELSDDTPWERYPMDLADRRTAWDIVNKREMCSRLHSTLTGDIVANIPKTLDGLLDWHDIDGRYQQDKRLMKLRHQLYERKGVQEETILHLRELVQENLTQDGNKEWERLEQELLNRRRDTISHIEKTFGNLPAPDQLSPILMEISKQLEIEGPPVANEQQRQIEALERDSTLLMQTRVDLDTASRWLLEQEKKIQASSGASAGPSQSTHEDNSLPMKLQAQRDQMINAAKQMEQAHLLSSAQLDQIADFLAKNKEIRLHTEQEVDAYIANKQGQAPLSEPAREDNPLTPAELATISKLTTNPCKAEWLKKANVIIGDNEKLIGWLDESKKDAIVFETVSDKPGKEVKQIVVSIERMGEASETQRSMVLQINSKLRNKLLNRPYAFSFKTAALPREKNVLHESHGHGFGR